MCIFIRILQQQGPQILERLGSSSLENQLKYQGMNQKLMIDNFDAQELLGDAVQEMQDIFELEKEDDHKVDFDYPSFLEDLQKYKNFMANLLPKLTETHNLAEAALLEPTPKAIFLQNQCYKTLGNICAQVVGQYELLGELLFSQQTIPDIKIVAGFIKLSFEYFEQRIQFITNNYLSQIRQIDPAIPNYEDVKNKMYIGVGKCISNIRNARSALLPLCKYLLAKKFLQGL